MSVVPFSVTAEVGDLSDGVMEYLGTIGFEDDRIEIRYYPQTFDTGQPDHTRLSLGLQEIERIDFKRGWFGGCQLTLRPSHVDAFGDSPLARDGRLTLSVARKHREAAVDLMAVVQTRLDFPEASRPRIRSAGD